MGCFSYLYKIMGTFLAFDPDVMGMYTCRHLGILPLEDTKKINAKTKSQRVEEGASIIAMAFDRVAVAA